MNRAFAGKAKTDDFESEDEESSMGWIPGFFMQLLEANFSWFAIKEMSYWIGLTVFSLVGYGFFCRLNHNLDMKELEIRKRFEEEQKNKNKQQQEGMGNEGDGGEKYLNEGKGEDENEGKVGDQNEAKVEDQNEGLNEEKKDLH